MTNKINLKELEAMVTNIVNELGVNEVFNEEMNKKIQEKIKSKINSEKIIKEEDIENSEEIAKEPITDSSETLKNIPSEVNNTTSQVVSAPISTTTPDIEPELPKSIEKAEPAQIFIFDQNELSFGGENLANKKFRLMSDPDKKESIHQMWVEDGKIRADVYIVKFEKLGQIKYNPYSVTAKLEEKRFDPELNNIAQPFNQNPFEPKVNSESNESFIINAEPVTINDNELEAKIYDIITKLVKGSTVHTATGPVGINIDAITAGQTKESSPMTLPEGKLKMLDLVKETEFDKISTPLEIIEGVEGKSTKAKLISKNEEVQSWLLEGEYFHLPVNIISARKCYKKTL